MTFSAPPAALLQAAAASEPGSGYLSLVLIISVLSLGAAVLLARYVLAQDTGTERMQEISDAIKEGAEAFLRRQNKTIIMLAVVLAVLIFLGYQLGKGDSVLARRVTISFVAGAICSLIAGFSGMWVSIRANIRVASAVRTSLNRGLQIALRGGAVTGLSVVAMSLLGVGGVFWAFGGLDDPKAVPFQIVGFAFGASFVALFAQLGGGIYTKAADVGADLFESTAAENIGAMVLGISLLPIYGIGAVLFPLLARAFGLIASMAGIMVVRTNEDADPMQALNRGYLVTTVLAIAGFYLAVYLLLGNNLWFFAAGVVGILTSFAFVWITQYYTEYRYRPVLSIAHSCKTGPATTIITGLAVAMECTAIPVLVISAAILLSYWFGTQAGLTGVSVAAAGLYGTAVATMGMLSTAAYILAMDTFGPITDNAGGIVEMSQQPEEIRRKTDRLDSVGNTTKALTKGYAIGSAALSAFLLFSAYLDAVKELTHVDIQVDLARPPVFVGALLGAMLVFLFSSFAIKAVGRTAEYIIEEVRRQFRENPGIMAGTSKPDYRRAVDIVTVGALKAMVVPGLLAVSMPVAVGVLFRHLQLGEANPTIGTEAVAAFLMVGTIGGILMATLMNNGGGAWDNAKKYIETGQLGGKGSDAHKAGVVGDTVGDPFKDTAGPSLHVLIKLLSTITLVAVPLFV
jgi:K(+)-stimulated pyrophosphate-energized sodium pump